MTSLIRSISGAIDALSEWTGRAIAWLTLLLVVEQFLVVVLRYAFQWGSIAMQESITYLHAAVFLGAAAYTLKRDGHVRVDIFYRQMSPKAKAWVNITGTLLFLMPTCAFIFWISLQYVGSAWAVREGSREAGGLPYVYWLKTLILVMPVLVLIQGISDLLRSLLVLKGLAPVEREPDQPKPTEEI